jgi:hypothetical protein
MTLILSAIFPDRLPADPGEDHSLESRDDESLLLSRRCSIGELVRAGLCSSPIGSGRSRFAE